GHFCRNDRAAFVHRLSISIPEGMHQLPHFVATRRMQYRFEQQMAEEETQIKRRVPVMPRLEIDQMNPSVGDENVFRTEVRKHHARLVCEYLRNQSINSRANFGMNLSNTAIKGIDPQLVEDLPVAPQ